MSLKLYRADGTQKQSDYLATPAALEGWHSVGAAGEPAFLNGWANFDANNAAQFRKLSNGVVELRGLVIGGSSGATVFNLPPGYRPAGGGVVTATSASPGVTRVDIASTNGSVSALVGGAGVWWSLSNIAFDTDSVSSLVVPVGQGPPLVAALPASPTDGQEVRYLADAVNGVIWSLRYRAGSSSPYKWEFVGGSDVRGAATMTGPLGTIGFVGPWVSAVTMLQQGLDVCGQGGYGHAGAEARASGVAVNADLRLRYIGYNSTGIGFGYRTLSARPVRVG